MANHGIGYLAQNVTNKVIAERVLRELKQKMETMKSETEIKFMNGRETIITKYFK